jgi:hypothetical protein
MWTIRSAQMDTLADGAFEEVLSRVAREVAASYPEVPWTLADRYTAWVRELLEAGLAFDLTLEENLLRFVVWHAKVGVHASVAEVFPWAFDLLQVEGEHESDRVAAVEARMLGITAEEG